MPTVRIAKLRIVPFLLMVLATGIGSGATEAADEQDVEQQTREFSIAIDGKNRGECTMEISRKSDGTERLKISSAIKLNYLVYQYNYSSVGTEVWKDDRLVELDNTAKFNRNQYRVRVAPGRRGMLVSVNGETQPLDRNVWVSSYWRMPKRLIKSTSAEDSKIRLAAGEQPAGSTSGNVPLLDSDKGRQLQGTLEFVDSEMISVAGHRVECQHFRISGDVQAELWYDKSLRLIRQQSVEEGHTTLLELTKVTRKKIPTTTGEPRRSKPEEVIESR